MANYNAGDMVRLTRKARGMSQEELCDNICSVHTLSRIENGKVRAKRDTYQKLMERMGRNGQKNYSKLSLEDFDALDLMGMIDNLIYRKDYAEAEKYLEQLKPMLDLENKINLQYIKRVESIIKYNKGVSSKEKYLKDMEEVASITISNYKKLVDKIYPFTKEEVGVMMNIAQAYGDMEENESSISIYYMLLRSLNSGYMSRKDAAPFILIMIRAIARMYGGLGKYQVAINMCWNVIHKSKKYKLYTILPIAYGEIAWNMLKQIDNGEQDERDKEEVKKIMRQGYAIASLTKQYVVRDIFKNHYYEVFKEEIYSFSISE